MRMGGIGRADTVVGIHGAKPSWVRAGSELPLRPSRLIDNPSLRRPRGADNAPRTRANCRERYTRQHPVAFMQVSGGWGGVRGWRNQQKRGVRLYGIYTISAGEFRLAVILADTQRMSNPIGRPKLDRNLLYDELWLWLRSGRHLVRINERTLAATLGWDRSTIAEGITDLERDGYLRRGHWAGKSGLDLALLQVRDPLPARRHAGFPIGSTGPLSRQRIVRP
jgi:hypothetical protein